MTNVQKAVLAAIAALGIGAAALYAQEPTPRPGPGPGWGMMGGPGYGYGPGPGRGFGPGMMGGRGMGMMGGPGFGMGMMGYGALAALDLSEAQRKQVVAIQDEVRKKNWAAMGSMQDEMAKLRDAMWAGERDRAAILAANKRMFEIRQQMLENTLDAADRIEKVLTPQQRAQLRKHAGPAWMIDPEE
jgi:Spy/CpxP family protein refolding chaperone